VVHRRKWRKWEFWSWISDFRFHYRSLKAHFKGAIQLIKLIYDFDDFLFSSPQSTTTNTLSDTNMWNLYSYFYDSAMTTVEWTKQNRHPLLYRDQICLGIFWILARTTPPIGFVWSFSFSDGRSIEFSRNIYPPGFIRMVQGSLYRLFHKST
jgi:hypothetical protein